VAPLATVPLAPDFVLLVWSSSIRIPYSSSSSKIRQPHSPRHETREDEAQKVICLHPPKKKKKTILLSKMREKIGEYDTAGDNESGRLTEIAKFSQKPFAEDKQARKEGAREREFAGEQKRL
jgi:hypothetical protein